MGDPGKQSESELADGHCFRFGQFVLDGRKRALYLTGSPVSLTPKAFDVLLFLVQNPNRLITKEELLRAVWGRTIVEEGNLTQYISHLRKALGESPEHPSLIVTIARKGYQFTGDVTVAETVDAMAQRAHGDAHGTQAFLRNKTVVKRTAYWRNTALGSTALLTAFVALLWLYQRHHLITLSTSDTVVLADLNNQTADPVFDDALNPALRVELEQTPYLNILDIDKANATLTSLGVPQGAKITPELARQVCLKTNSNLVISASISDAGNRYRLKLRALGCESGESLAEEQEDVDSRNEVVHELGATAARFRTKLGEPADSLAHFNQPLDKALTSSLEALSDNTQGARLHLGGNSEGGLKLLQRSAELDPNFALNHLRMGATYLFLGKTDLGFTSYTRAYQLRDRLTERSRFGAEISYYTYVIGDIEREYRSALKWVELFPRDVSAHAALRNVFLRLGQPDRGADEAEEIARLRPSAYDFGAAIQSTRFAGRFAEAKAKLAQADTLKFDSTLIRRERLIVAFATHDQQSVEAILKTEEQGKNRDDFLFEHSLIEIQQGRFQSAERLRQGRLGQASKPANADWWMVLSALENAEVGNDTQARKYEDEAIQSDLDRGDKVALALALAISGRTSEAGALADQVSADRPDDTLVQKYYVPTIRASIKLHERDPSAAIDLLRETAKYDLAFTPSFNYLYPAYIRGLAYLDLGDGKSAASQFQKQIDNPGFGVRHVIGPLAWLQLGRAQNMMGDETDARKSYETFLDLWKNADADLPIYQQAKAEYFALREKLNLPR